MMMFDWLCILNAGTRKAKEAALGKTKIDGKKSMHMHNCKIVIKMPER